MWRVITWYRSHVSTIAFILCGKLIAELFDIYSELVRNYISCSGSVVIGVMSFPGVGPPMRQLFIYTELLSHESPVLVEVFEFPDKICQYIPVGIHKPI